MIKTQLFLFLCLAFLQPSYAFQPDSLNYRVSFLPHSNWILSMDDEDPSTIRLPYVTPSNAPFSVSTSFPTDLIKDRVLEVRLPAINFKSELYINGQFAGSFLGGYLPKSFILQDEWFSQSDSQSIQIRVDQPLNFENSIPFRPRVLDPKLQYGILGDVTLISRPLISVETPTIQYYESDGRIILNPSLNIRSGRFTNDSWRSNGTDISVHFQVSGMDTLNPQPLLSLVENVQIQSNRLTSFSFEPASVNLIQWTPENPVLYRASLTLSANGETIDSVSFSVGVRQLDLSTRQPTLNGNPITLRGVTYMISESMTLEQVIADLQLIKSIGLNTVYFKQQPVSDEVATICDQIGLLVLTEVPVHYPPGSSVDNQGFYQNLIQNYQALQAKLSHHPSVIALGLGGPYLELTESFFQSINGTVHQPAFLLSGPEITGHPETGFRVVDARHLTEIEFDQFLSRMSENSDPVTVMLGTEIEPGNHNGFQDERSHEFQAKYILDRFRLIESANIPVNVIMDSFLDIPVSLPRLVTGDSDPFSIYTGLVNDDRTFRLGMDYLKSAINNEVMFNPTLGARPAEVQVVFPVVGVLLIFIFVSFYTSNRRFRDNFARSFHRSFSFFSDIRDNRIILGLQTLGLIFLISGSVASFLLSVGYAFRHSNHFDYLLSAWIPSAGAKLTIIHWILNPVGGILLLLLIVILVLFILTFILVLMARLLKIRLTTGQILVTTIWSVSPVIFLTIPTLFMEQLVIGVSGIDWATVIAILLLLFYLVSRLLKGYAIIFGDNSRKVYLIGIVILMVLIGGTIAIYEANVDLLQQIIHSSLMFR